MEILDKKKNHTKSESVSPAGPLGRRPSEGPLPQHAVQLYFGADVQHFWVRLLHGRPG